MSLRHAAHVQEGRDRFKQPDPVDTLFETAEQQLALLKLYRELQYFPTQPWTVRALLQLLRSMGHPMFADGAVRPVILDPAAGRGHIVVPLRQAGFTVKAADIHDFGKGYEIRDFLADRYIGDDEADLIFMNPPFSDKTTPRGEPGLAERFVRRALDMAPEVFVLARLGFLKVFGRRYDLHTRILTDVYVNTDRCDMVLGRYDPKADTATETAWFRFQRCKTPSPTFLTHLIPPGLKDLLMQTEDLWI